MASFAEVKGHDRKNIRKVLEMSIFAKPYVEGDDEITHVWDGSGLVVPTGYVPVGLTTKDDGATWTRDQESSDVTSHGYAEPTRRDIISDVSGVSFIMQETKRQSLEMYHHRSLEHVTPDEHGNIVIDRAARPQTMHWRLLALGKDGFGSDAIYVARWLPNAQVTENADQSWSEGEEVRYPATLTAYQDDEFGTAFREIWGGPGLDHEAMGFPAPTEG